MAISLKTGGYAFLFYYGDVYWHQRLLIGRLEDDFWYICTPDGDMYDEQISDANPDLVNVKGGTGDDGLGVPVALGELVHCFKRGFGRVGLTEIKHGRLMAEGKAYLEEERERRGVPETALAEQPRVEARAPSEHSRGEPRLPPPAGIWVMAETAGSLKIGDSISPSVDMVKIGDTGLDVIVGEVRQIRWLSGGPAEKDAFIKERGASLRSEVDADGAVDDAATVQGPAEDVRTMSVKFGRDGSRRRTFRESLEEMEEVPFDDWPVDGPRTCQWVTREISRLAEGPRAQHALWLQGSRIPDGDRAIHEDSVLAQILETAVTYDALNVNNLACMELVVRRRQLLAEAHVANPSAPSYEGGDYFLGAGRTASGAVIAPALTSHVSDRLRGDAAIQKEKRKIAENRTLQVPRKQGKGAGKAGGEGGTA